jgi:predicted RNA-binding Zn ribbon-like protein
LTCSAGWVTDKLQSLVMAGPRKSQPGGRAAAPGELALVQDFVNTANIEAAEDALESAAALRSFLARSQLPGARSRVTADDLVRARELREALRALAAANNGEPFPPAAAATLDRCARRSRLVAGFAPTGEPRELVTASGVDRAFGELLAIVHRAIRNGMWSRLKACHEHGCRWIFYDHSRNRSGTWCTMSLCGARAKMRTYRARRGAGTDSRQPRR